MGAPFPGKSPGSCMTFCEYRLLTRSAVLSARWRGWGPRPSSSGPLLRDRLESCEGRPADDSVAAPMPWPAGMGALIWRGALMVGAFFLLLSPRFLRSEMPFCFSDMAGSPRWYTRVCGCLSGVHAVLQRCSAEAWM